MKKITFVPQRLSLFILGLSSLLMANTGFAQSKAVMPENIKPKHEVGITAPGSISAQSIEGTQDRVVKYQIADIPTNVSFVEWSIPEGGTIISGQGTSSIAVQYHEGAVKGEVSALFHYSRSPLSLLTVDLPSVEEYNEQNRTNPGNLVFTPTTSRTENNTNVGGTGLASTLYPNPVHDIAKLTVVSNNNDDRIQIRITDEAGRLRMVTSMDPNTMIYLGGRRFTPGYYYIEIMQGAEKIIQKMIVK